MDEKVKSFEDLWVWQKGIDLVKKIYLLTGDGSLNRDFGFRDQIRRAAVSIPTNIAEGYERSSRKEYLQFLNIAKGSAGEVRSLLRIALDIGYVSQDDYHQLRNSIMDLSRYLSNQIKSLRIPKQ